MAAGFLQTASESNISESYRCCAVTANVDTFNLTSCKCRNSLYQMDSISFCTIISDIAYLSPALFMWQSRYSILCTLYSSPDTEESINLVVMLRVNNGSVWKSNYCVSVSLHCSGHWGEGGGANKIQSSHSAVTLSILNILPFPRGDMVMLSNADRWSPHIHPTSRRDVQPRTQGRSLDCSYR